MIDLAVAVPAYALSGALYERRLTDGGRPIAQRRRTSAALWLMPESMSTTSNEVTGLTTVACAGAITSPLKVPWVDGTLQLPPDVFGATTRSVWAHEPAEKLPDNCHQTRDAREHRKK